MNSVHILCRELGEMPILGIFEQIAEGVSAMEHDSTFGWFLITC